MHSERLAHRPAIDGVVSEVHHRAPVRVHTLPVERGEYHLSLPEMLGAIEQEQRVRAQKGLEDGVRLPRVPFVGPECEDLLDDVRIGYEHQRGWHRRKPNRESFPVPSLMLGHHPKRVADPTNRLEGRASTVGRGR